MSHVLKRGECPECDLMPKDISHLRADLATARAEVERLTRERDEARAALRELLEAAELLVDDYAKRHRAPVKFGILRAVLEAGAARRILAQDPGTTGGSGEGGT